MSAPGQLCSSHSRQILPHSTISPQNHPTRRVKPSVSRRFWRHKSGGVASGSPRVPRCEQALRCDFTHYSQSGGGSQMEPVNYRCLNCRGVRTHTYTRAPLYCLIGVNNGSKLICRFGISRYVLYIYIYKYGVFHLHCRCICSHISWRVYRIYDCSAAKSIGYQGDSSPSARPYLHLIFSCSTSAHH